MNFTAKQIAELLEGTIEGNAEVSVNQLSKIEEGVPGSLTFLANPKYTPFIYSTKASLVIVDKTFVAEQRLEGGCTLIRVEDPYRSFAKLLELYNQIKNNKSGIHPKAIVENSAKLGKDVYLGPGVYVGENASIADGCKIFANTTIGDNSTIDKNTTLFAGVQVYSDSKIGAECVIHSGTIIGADGFGFTPNSENNYQKVAQIGNVIIEDHVEIGANTCIDRATLGSTIIRKGVKLDNLIQIAHNVEIGENTVMAAQCGIAGSTKIGKNCMLGGQVGLAGHLTIADGVKIAAQSGIGKSITQENTIVQGSPAFSIGDYNKSYVGFRKLPEIMKTLHELQKEIKELKNTVDK